MKSGAIAPHQCTSEPGNISNSETLKEQSSSTVKMPRSWCWTILNSVRRSTRGLVLEQMGSGSAWQKWARKWRRRNPKKKGFSGMRSGSGIVRIRVWVRIQIIKGEGMVKLPDRGEN